jgi:IS5 family transposase
MVRQVGMFDVEARLAGLSKKGDDLERLQAVVDFEVFRPELERAVPRADRSKGGRPPFDHVLMFKVLILQTQNSLSDERTEFYLGDRLTWMRFLGLGLGDPVPDANTIWTFREALTKAGAIERLFTLYDRQLRARGYLAMSGQLVDASIVAAPKQRNTKAEKQAIREGRVPEDWQDKPAKLSQKDRDARWTVKTTKAKPREGETPMVDLAIPEFGYQNHISADRRHRLIRRWLVTDAAAHAGARLADLLDPGNTASEVWADTGYRSKKNEEPAPPADAQEPYPPEEAGGPADAGSHRPGEREEVGRARPRRARLRRAEPTATDGLALPARHPATSTSPKMR